jgi:thioredoxin reductase
MANMENENFEVVIIGGSYAGLAAAMALGRAIRKVLVIDSGQPCNRQTPHAHNFLTLDGTAPAEIAAMAKQQVLAYPTIRFENDLVTNVTGSNNDFLITTAGLKAFTARKILFATGIKDIMPDIPGFSESWGISVIHCPYCHGYEYRGQHTGILMNGEMSFEFVKLIGNWSQKLTLFTNGAATFDKGLFQKITNPDFKIVEKEILELSHDNGHLKEVIFRDGSSQKLEALYAKVPFVPQTDIPEKLGCLTDDSGYIKVDDFKRTSVPGIYAAGDNTTPMRALAAAIAAGNMAGALLNKELIDDQYSV